MRHIVTLSDLLGNALSEALRVPRPGPAAPLMILESPQLFESPDNISDCVPVYI